MNRADAIREIVARHPHAAIVFANGLNSREASAVADRPQNLYLLHGMGEAVSVGVGLKTARPDLEVVVVDGDGNAWMGLAALSLLPRDGIEYYVLANGTYETTGAQRVPDLSGLLPRGAHLIPIEAGTLQAPLPPPPAQLLARFQSWLATCGAVAERGP